MSAWHAEQDTASPSRLDSTDAARMVLGIHIHTKTATIARILADIIEVEEDRRTLLPVRELSDPALAAAASYALDLLSYRLDGQHQQRDPGAAQERVRLLREAAGEAPDGS